MRIWDIHPGYLNRQSLLGEHRELHGMVSIITQHKTGYSHHPETLRWVHYRWALKKRHALLAAEMALRGYTDRSPVIVDGKVDQWPPTYIDEPFTQFDILAAKYVSKEPGRIPLPQNAQQLWSHHKYSVLARDIEQYKKIGQRVSEGPTEPEFKALAGHLTELLRIRPAQGGIINALQHMWGHVSNHPPAPDDFDSWSPGYLLEQIQKRSIEHDEPYLLHSTALSELAIWMAKE